MASYDHIDTAIFRHMQAAHKLAIGERMAARIRMAINSMPPLSNNVINVEVHGRDMVSGVPKKLIITGEEICEAVRQ